MTISLRHTMRVVTAALWGFCSSVFFSPALAQETSPTDLQTSDYDSLLSEYLLMDSLLLDELLADSTSFFQMLDDLVEEKYIKSALNIRLGYSGQVSNAGRSIGIDQYGFNAGLSFYHKSGIYADVSGFWNSDQTPSYNTTITSLGYMGNFTTNWSYWASYDHYFFSPPEDESITYPFTNGINASSSYYIKKFVAGLDYSFTFGDETAHRIRVNAGYNMTKTKWWIFDRISVNPNLSMLMGNANVVTWVINTNQVHELIKRIGYRRFRYLKENYPNELEAALSYPVDENAFGIMNYSLFVPVSFSIKKTTLMVNYTLNMPIALPNEQLDTSLNNYVSATLMYTF